MKPWTTIAREKAPDGAELMLQQRDGEFSIRANGWVLMTSRITGSEKALAQATCSRLPAEAKVLVGGLGMGFTLRAALDCLGRHGHVVVAELTPAVVAWNRGPLGPLTKHPLADPRVQLFNGDVRRAWKELGPFDAILLDVDNGPNALTLPGNQTLYSRTAMSEGYQALRGKGVLGVWSIGPAPAFLERLRGVGFEPERQVVKGGQHELLLGWKRGGRRGNKAWTQSAPRIKEAVRDSLEPRAPGHRRRRR